ncbi:MAG: YezD family protein [Bacillaceae bacterium]|nr:YezD family protein [Bacillaceae bacterium]
MEKQTLQNEKLFLKIQAMLKGFNYGSITLIVQDGKVIQLEKNEKVRLK